MTKVIAIVFTFLLLASVSNSYDPPKGLKWCTSYEEIKENLKNSKAKDKLKIKKLSKKNKSANFYPESKLPEGFKSSYLDKYKVLDKKAMEGFAIFHDSCGLSLVQFQFLFVAGSETEEIEKTWEFYQKLFSALQKKYGSPTRNQITSIDYGTVITKESNLQTIWIDSVNQDRIRLIVTKHKKGVSFISTTNYYVILEYCNQEWIRKEGPEIDEEDI